MTGSLKRSFSSDLVSGGTFQAPLAGSFLTVPQHGLCLTPVLTALGKTPSWFSAVCTALAFVPSLLQVKVLSCYGFNGSDD